MSEYNHSYPESTTISPSYLRDNHMSLNAIPVYRHGRKFYVSAEESERIRAEERRHRRMIMQKSQNLPVPKSNQTNVQSSSIVSYNPSYRSTSQLDDHKHGVLRTFHRPMDSTIMNTNRHELTRQSRSTFQSYDDRDNLLSMRSVLPIKLPTTGNRSNSSDKVLDLRRNFQSSYNDSISDDYELKRSLSAEIIQPQQSQLQELSSRINSTTMSDYGMSTIPSSSLLSMKSTDQTYNQSNNLKFPNYSRRMQSPTINSPIKSFASELTATNSMYEAGIQDSNRMYSSLSSPIRRIGHGILTRSSSNNNNHEYYFQDTSPGKSFSDDNTSAATMLIRQENKNNNRYQTDQFNIERDDHHRGQQNDRWIRSTIQSQSSDGLTEKKRVRFADMEGFTLETVSDVEQQGLSKNNWSLPDRTHVITSNNVQGQVKPFQNLFYQTNSRFHSIGSKLATDV